jgi:hypothetical protein
MLLRSCSAGPSGFIEPCLPSRADRPPSGPDWIHEIKHDGYRLMARRDVTRPTAPLVAPPLVASWPSDTNPAAEMYSGGGTNRELTADLSPAAKPQAMAATGQAARQPRAICHQSGLCRMRCAKRAPQPLSLAGVPQFTASLRQPKHHVNNSSDPIPY